MKSILRIIAASGLAALVSGFVVAGASADNGNTQTAGNIAISTQSATAVSGDAWSTYGSKATTGDALAVNLLLTSQKVEQDASNRTSTCKCDNYNFQDGLNVMEKSQESLALTGNADASWFSYSSSGDVAAVNIDLEKQKIEQDASNKLESHKKKFRR
jgi:hypothetical protein